jgi:hypothetical protein
MVPERVHCDATHFRIFTLRIISANERLRFVAHGFLNRALSRYGSATSSLGSAPGREDFSAALSGIAAQSSSTFAF